MKITSLSAALFALLSAAALLPAQPSPVPGTEMVPNEYGSSFPREIVWQKDGQVMVLIPHGSFRQGLDRSRGGSGNEEPERTVTLPSFYIDKYEVSNEVYNKAMRAATLPLPRPGNAALSDPQRPATGFPYIAAEGYAKWAGKEIPTEAMWEKAARGPSGTVYTTGNTAPAAGVIVAGQSAATGLPVPVMQDTGDRSGYGIFHMGGNVSEFCSDWYARDAYQDSRTNNPTGPASGESRVIRGGNYSSKIEEARAVTRNAIPLSQIRDEVGFRTVWVPRPVPKVEVTASTPIPTPPPITRAEIVTRLSGSLAPYIQREDMRLPAEMMAGRALRTKGLDEVTFVNLSPWRMTLTFVGPEQELVYHYLEPLPAMTFRQVKLPKEVDLRILGYAAEAPEPRILDLGNVRAESRAILVATTELLGPVVDPEGNEIPGKSEMEQYYSGFQPQWNELEMLNTLRMPVVIRIEDLSRGEDRKETLGSFTVDPARVMRISLAPARYRFHADYPGALEESGSPQEVKIDDRAARRLMRIEQDVTNSETVTVITEKRPRTKMVVVEAKRPVSSSK